VWLSSGGNKIMASTVFGAIAGFFTGSISSVMSEPHLKRAFPQHVTSKGMGIIAGQLLPSFTAHHYLVQLQYEEDHTQN
jgi:hypothetical protein